MLNAFRSLALFLCLFAVPAMAGVTALTDGASIAWNAGSGTSYSLTLGGDHTIQNPTNVVAGTTYVLTVTQDSTGGRTLSYSSAFQSADATFPTLSTRAGAVDVLQIYAADSSTLIVSALTKNAQTLVKAPSGMTATDDGSGNVSLAWTNNATDGTAVEFWTNTLGGDQCDSPTSPFWSLTSTLSASAATATDSPGVGNTVCYRVRTERSDVVSAFSNTVKITPQ